MYRALVVDDEKWSLLGICRTFRWQEYGFQLISGVLNPKAALELIEKEKPDVVFSDIRMPGLTGLELISKAKKEADVPEFVIISGFSEFEYARQAITHHVFDYCLKPVSQNQADDLLARLRQQLDQKQKERRQSPENSEDGQTGFGAMLAYIQENLNKPITLKDVAAKFFVTPNHCCYLFQTQLNTTYSEYITRLRIEKAKSLLSDTNRYVYEIADEVGYDDPQYFNRVFRQEVSCTPLEYRRNCRERAKSKEA